MRDYGSTSAFTNPPRSDDEGAEAHCFRSHRILHHILVENTYIAKNNFCVTKSLVTPMQSNSADSREVTAPRCPESFPTWRG